MTSPELFEPELVAGFVGMVNCYWKADIQEPHIVIEHSDDPHDPDDCLFASYSHNIAQLTNVLPGLQDYLRVDIAETDGDLDAKLYVAMPGYWRSLRTELQRAGIDAPLRPRLVPTLDEIPCDEYRGYIEAGEAPMSHGLEMYLHDTVDHMLGVLGLSAESYAIFRRLLWLLPAIRAELGADLGVAAQGLLVGAYDGYTEQHVLGGTAERPSHPQSLLNQVDVGVDELSINNSCCRDSDGAARSLSNVIRSEMHAAGGPNVLRLDQNQFLADKKRFLGVLATA